MWLKSLLVTNQRISRTCVANIFMLCLLTSKVCSFANIQQHNRFARQLNDEMAVNYEDISIATNPYHRPHFIENRSIIVQLFEWKFVDIAAECRDFLGPQGYGGVQLSPVLEHTVVKTANFDHPWWERLEVVSYRLASRSGNEAEFWSMSRICNEHGVRIYADVVLNHMAAPLHYLDDAEAEQEDFIVDTLLETNTNLSQLQYSHVPYTHSDFHKPACMVMTNTQDAHVIRNCQLNGHPDLDHSRGNVQKRIVNMLNKFVDMGVAGFRVDTSKYMWPIDLKNIFKQVKNLSTEFNFKENTRPFVYFDVFDLGLDAISKTEYSTYGVVSEYLYAAELSTILKGKAPLSSLINWGPAMGFLAHDDSFVFIDSPDTQRGMPWELGHNKMLTFKQRIKYVMANVFMLVHPYGAVKKIMSSYYFPNGEINQGPPTEEADETEIRSPSYDELNQCTKESGWVCEHRWPQIVNLVKVANFFKAAGNKEESVLYFQTNGPNQVAFCRGQKAFVAINNDAENDFIKEVYACLEPGMYCDMVTGGKKDGLESCHGKVLEVNDQGYMKLELNVADDKRSNNEEGVAAEELDDEEGADEQEEASGEIQSYGIVVIYVESKIKPADKTAEDATPTGSQEENTKTKPENEGKLSAEHEEAVQEEESDGKQDQQEDEADHEELTREQEEGVEEEEKAQEAGGEAAEEEEVAEAKSEGEEQINEEIVNEETSSVTDNPNQNEAEEEKESNENENNEEDTEVESEGEGKPEIPNEEEEPMEEDSGKKAEENEEQPGGDLEGDPPEDEENGIETEGESEETKENRTKQEEAHQEDETEEQPKDNSEQDPSEDKEEEGNEETAGTEPETEALAVDDSAKEEEEAEQQPEGETVEDPSKDAAAESDKELNEDVAASTDTGNNQSRNLDKKKNTDEIEEQIEKPSAEIVEEAGDILDTVTAKIQDVQKAGIFSNDQDGENDG